MKILITGATGFIGRHLVEVARSAGHTIHCLARRIPDDLEGFGDVTFHTGDVTDEATLKEGFDGMDAVLHLVGIIEEKSSSGVTFERVHTEGTRNVVRRARAAGIETFVQMSANGARPGGVSRYQTSKFEAEQIVQSAGFSRWTVIRPTVVFGPPAPGCPEFASQLVSDLLRPFPVWPVFGNGLYEMQPIHVKDLVHGFVKSLDQDATKNRVFNAGGPGRIAYKDLLPILAEGAGLKQRPRIHVPIPLVSPAVSLFGGWLMPITRDQFDMLIEGNTCDSGDFMDAFDIDPIPFTPEHLRYLEA